MADENRFVRRTDVYSLFKNVMFARVWSFPRSTCKTETRCVIVFLAACICHCRPDSDFSRSRFHESVICSLSSAPFRLVRTGND